MKKRSIFVTVGTTLFEALIDGVTTETALEWMSTNGYTHLVIQYGKGKAPSVIQKSNNDGTTTNVLIAIEAYDFKPSLESDMVDADLIISHAGAGTVMECLRLQKRMVVVINTILMDNHQTELANAMGQRHHIHVIDTPELLQDVTTWNKLEAFRPVPKDPGDEYDFARLLNHFMGFDKDS